MATVLVVEKESNMRLLLELELADARYQSLAAADQSEVEDVMQFEHPDVAILGMGPHVDDEFRTLYWMKCQFPDLPIVLYAAGMDLSSSPVVRLADAVVVKRSDPEPLLHTLDGLTRRTAGLSVGS